MWGITFIIWDFGIHFCNSIYLLILCGDLEQNPGPKDAKYLSLCYWNLNNLAAHDFAKVSALKNFNVTEKLDFICSSESYLDSIISSDDSSPFLVGYNLICANHPKNIKQGEVCIYCRETLPVKTIQINYLCKCLVCEVNKTSKIAKLWKQNIFIVTLYRSPSQNDFEFDEFLRSFESVIDNINQSNPYFVLITGEFNLLSNNWLGNVINNFAGISIKNHLTV